MCSVDGRPVWRRPVLVMTNRVARPNREPPAPSAGTAAHRDYTGAVYGSMLAASVVAGAGALDGHPRLEMILLLLGTGLVFWGAHVHARLFGTRLGRRAIGLAQVRRACAEEWPIVKAAVPPAAAVAVGPVFRLDLDGSLWLALAVALAGQVGWAATAARRSGASWAMVAVTGAVNLLLGLLIVTLKAALHH